MDSFSGVYRMILNSKSKIRVLKKIDRSTNCNRIEYKDI